MILWRRKLEARPPGYKRMADLRLLELEIAKQILEEVFHARPSDVEDMIQRRIEEVSRNAERIWQEEDGLRPQEFCAGD
jgi:hypothetical protein